MFRKSVFILAHSLGDRDFFSTYQKLIRDQWKPYEDLKLEQERHLRHLIRFSFENVPYYRNLFKEQNLLPKDIRTIDDLEKIPVLTKEIIKKSWDDFKPAGLSSMKYDTRATGGSTGTPLQYRVENHDRFLSGALMYRGWGYGGYELGDRMVFLAGSSLGVGTQPWLNKRAHEISRNVKKLSSFDMADAEMRQYSSIMISYKPLFIQGYASSIYYFARWAKENRVAVPRLKGVFTTAERLFPNMRETIGQVFGCEVFDGYGLNDGGITAFECPEHTGMHIDTDRSILEVVDSDHHQVVQGQGEILATSLYNFAMPFIRYSTGDFATLRDDECSCGRHLKLLDEIVGREKELLISPSGRIVHGAALIGLIYIVLESSAFPGVVNQIQQYQIVQKVKEKIELRLVCDAPLPGEVLNYIQQLVSTRFDGWQVEFVYVDAIEPTRAGKYKFIINEMVKNE